MLLPYLPPSCSGATLQCSLIISYSNPRACLFGLRACDHPLIHNVAPRYIGLVSMENVCYAFASVITTPAPVLWASLRPPPDGLLTGG